MKRVRVFLVAAFVLATAVAFRTSNKGLTMTAYYQNPDENTCVSVSNVPCNTSAPTGCYVLGTEYFNLSSQKCNIRLAHD